MGGSLVTVVRTLWLDRWLSPESMSGRNGTPEPCWRWNLVPSRQNTNVLVTAWPWRAKPRVSEETTGGLCV